MDLKGHERWLPGAPVSAPVDHDEREKREESNMQMDDMAIEWVEQVLSFLPITDVYKCRSVCKKWQAAANYVLSDWETLELMFRDGKTRPVRTDKNQVFLNNITIQSYRRPRLAQVMTGHEAKDQSHDLIWIERLNQLVRLKEIRLVVYDASLCLKLLAVTYDVVLRNANTLNTLLNIDLKLLPFNPNLPVVFHNLKHLECGEMVIDQAAAFPRLVKLSTITSVKSLQKLPAETLTSLHIDYVDLEAGSPEEIGQLAAALSRLTRLKRLILDERSLESVFRYFDPNRWTELHDRAFSKLFTIMKVLEEVDISFPVFEKVDVDAVIESLVTNCPSVRSISLVDGRMTNAGLHSLSRLTGLQNFSHGRIRFENEITTEGILSLLRGRSRNVLRKLKLKVSGMPDFDQIYAEGELMQQETGRSLFIMDQNDNISIAIRSGL